MGKPTSSGNRGRWPRLPREPNTNLAWWLAIATAVTAFLMGITVWLVIGSEAVDIAQHAERERVEASRASDDAERRSSSTAGSERRSEEDAAPAASGAPESASSSRAVLVRVVHASNGAPAPGARVWVQREGQDPAEWARAWDAFGDLGAVLSSGLGLEHTADERGLMHLPEPESGLWVFAELGEERGEGRVERGKGECTLSIARTRSVEVLTVDGAGKPLSGVLVAMVRLTTPGWGEIARGVTGADGRRVLYVDSEASDTLDPPAVLAPMLVQSEPAGIEVQPASLPREVVRFVIGPHGRVIVRAVDERGQRRRARGSAGLGADAARNVELPAAQVAGPWLDRPLEDGEAVFERVGVGLALRAWVEARGFDVEMAEAGGPQGPGAESLVEIPVLRRRLSVRGRALEEDGDSLGAARVWGWLAADGGHGEQVLGVWTDELGRFADRGGEALAAADVGTEIVLEGARDGEVARRGLARLPEPDEEGVLDLGELALYPIALVASGRVELSDGEPVNNAEVTVAGTELVGRSSQSGLFAISGEAPASAFELVARDWLYLSGPPVPARAGQENVLIRMRRGARLAGRLVLPSGVVAHTLQMIVDVEPNAPGSAPWRYEGFDLGPGGEYEIAPLETGRARLSIGLVESELPLAEGLRLREGEACRVETIDLVGRIGIVHLVVAGDDGQPLPSGTVHRLSSDGQRVTSQPLRPDGGVALPSLAPRVDVEVEAPDRPPARFFGVADGNRLVVGSGVRVRLVLDSASALPGGASLIATARSGTGTQTIEVRATVAGVGAGEPLLLSVRTWSLRWSVRRPDGREVELSSGLPTSLQVAAGQNEVAVPASVGAEEVAAAVSGS